MKHIRTLLSHRNLLIFTIIIAAFFRFFSLGSLPPSLTWDEVAWGYNAYTLGIDGRDEFGRFLPVDYLESFGDFKPPVYAYLDILPIKFLGLTEFAVRFPSALFGVLTVFITYFLVRRIFYQSKHKESYALVTSFILAVSPWHVLLSRAAFEANVATFFLVSGVWLFLVAMQKKPWMLTLSAVSFVLSMYTFNTSRIVAPLLVLLLAVVFRKQLFAIKKHVLIAIVVGIVLLLPTLPFLFSSQASLRFKEVNIFSDIDMIKRTNQEIANDHNAWWSNILHNRRLVYSVEYLKHYFDNLSFHFLFITGDGNPKFATQAVGQLYLWELPFFIVGILFLIRKREGYWFLVPLWILLGIIPAATARETPHALRIETTLPMFQLLVAYGLVTAFGFFKKRFRKRMFLFICSVIGVIAFVNILYFAHDYYRHYPLLYSGEWQYGYKESIAFAQEQEDNFDTIVVTTKLGRPYIYYLFYDAVAPQTFRKEAKVDRDSFGFVTVDRFGKYVFADNPNDVKLENKKVLYIASPDDVPENVHILKKFNLLNGETTIIVYTRK